MPDLHAAFAAEPDAGGDLHASFASEKEAPSTLDAVGMGLHQGTTFGFGDELHGAEHALKAKLLDLVGLEAHPEGIGELYRKARDEYRAHDAAAKAAHPTAHGVADFAGGMAAGAVLPVGKVASIGKALAVGAGMGAAHGLGTSNADLTQGDVGGAAADTAKGAALGAAGGAVGFGAEKALTPVAQSLRSFAARRAVTAAGPTAGQVKQLAEKGAVEPMGDFLLDKGLVRAGRTSADVGEKAGALQADAGKRIEGALGALDASGAPGPQKMELAARFRALAHDAAQEGPGAQPLVDRYRAAATEVEKDAMNSGVPDLTFAGAEQWKRGYQNRVNYARKNPSAAQQGDQELASAARQHVEDAADKAAAQSGNPELANSFEGAKSDYGNASRAVEMTEGASGRDLARNIASPSDKATAIGGVLAGHPLLGVAGAMLNKQVRTRAASTLAVGARSASDKLAALAKTAPGQLGRYGSILSSALQQGPSAFNAHVYTLSQTDPEFQRLQAKLAKSEE